MLTAITQTLAEILACGSSLGSTEQIDLGHPSQNQVQSRCPKLNLYCYHIRQNTQMPPLSPQLDIKRQPIWLDVSFLVTAWDYTVLGEQRLLSEILMLLLPYHHLPEALLHQSLQGYGGLPIKVSASGITEIIEFWRALNLPLRPALYLTVTIPWQQQPKLTTPTPKVLLKEVSVHQTIN